LCNSQNGNTIACDSALSKLDPDRTQGVDDFNVFSAAVAADRRRSFPAPLPAALHMLRYSGTARRAASAVRATESLDFNIKELEKSLGWLPDGLQPSKSCVGLNLTDKRINSAHIYWHRKHRRFTSWSR
jgi:hypothetical protein